MSDKFLTNGAQNRSSSHPKRKPFCVVRHQSASVPIYAHQVHGKTRYTIAFYLDGRRKRRCCRLFAAIGRRNCGMMSVTL